MAMDHMLRVIVGTAGGPTSGMWRFFTSGDDIYVQHDGMRKDLKTSLHASGVNHTAFTPSGAARWQPDGDRYIAKWDEPSEFAPGARTLLGIVLPTDHLMVPDSGPPVPKSGESVLLAPAPATEAITLSVILTDPDTRLTAPKNEPSALLTAWELPTRGTVWIVGSSSPWDGFRNAVVAALPQMRDQFDGQIGHSLKPGDRETARAILWTDPDERGVPHMVEVGIAYGVR
jgi:hypothetical protein